MCIARDLLSDDIDVFGLYLEDYELYSSLYIYSTCVKSKYRGKNVPNILYDSIRNLYPTHDIYVDIQHNPHNNIASLKFHEKYGFLLLSTCIYKGSIYGLYKIKFNKDKINTRKSLRLSQHICIR